MLESTSSIAQRGMLAENLRELWDRPSRNLDGREMIWLSLPR